jgi:CubicO group peptidase (beta-lactamase class C family)
MKRVIVFTCLFGFSFLNGQSTHPLHSINKKIDSIVSFFNNSSFPATTLGIIKNGRLIYNKGFGKEDLEKNIIPTSKSNFNLASNSKQFTAMCIMLLQEEGKLKRIDDIRKYLPEIPIYDKPITIEDLLHHTSGLRDYLELYHLTCKPVFELSQKEILKLISDQKHLNFSPGEYHLYSNTNYFLLAIIIERVSGISFNKYIRENIFTPLGMKHTYFSDEKSVTNEAKNYKQTGNTFLLNKNTYPTIYGDGGILSNIDDLLLWDQNFYHNVLGKKTNKIVTEIQETGKLNNKENTFYAGGLFNIQYKGRQAILHGGGFNSFSTQILRFPSDSLSIILLSAVNNDPDYYCFQIADLFFKSNPQSNPPTPTNRLIGQNISGYYFNETLSGCRSITQNDNFITANGVNFTQIGSNQYLAENIWGWEKYLNFSTSPKGEVLMNYHVTYINDTYKQIKEDTLSKNCNGNYSCQELPNLKFELKFVGNKPVFLVNGKYSADVTKTFGTIGIIPTFGAIVEFQVNSENKVIGFNLSTDRVKNLFFQKNQ